MKNWIWLSNEKYPEYQKSFYSAMRSDLCPGARVCIAEFKKTYKFDKKVKFLALRVSGDTQYYLELCGEALGVGPAVPGGDFLCKTDPLQHYADNFYLDLDTDTIDFYARVLHNPILLTDYSKGHGGLLVEGTAEFEDGSVEYFSTDETWLARVDRTCTHVSHAGSATDLTVPCDEWINAEFTPDIWNVLDSEIDTMTEEVVYPIGEPTLSVDPGETKEFTVEFEKIHAAYCVAEIDGKAYVEIQTSELPGRSGETDKIRTDGPFKFRSFKYHSTGALKLTITNEDQKTVNVKPSIVSRYYPIYADGGFKCNDEDLNLVFDVIKWTLKICRQTIHIDSPKHQELLACTGDYYLDMLMTAYTYGDMALSEFDVKRTADWLVINDGVMFHTNYSLIWVMMLRDTYMFSGNKELLYYCLRGLKTLMNKFHSYLGDNGLMEKAPNYMFVDHVTRDGYTLHHPPKYLGQSVLTAFYYGALNAAADIYKEVGDNASAEEMLGIAAVVKKAFNDNLYDEEMGLYFEGLGTPDQVAPNGDLPENQNKKFFGQYANIFACMFGICEGDKAKEIMRRVVTDETLPDIEPYNFHWKFEALSKVGLFEEYALGLIERWKPLVKECSKGLKEGWKDPKGYGYDFSHSWGGTPCYQLPAKTLGFKMIEPGFKKISLSPTLLGLESAEITMPTPYGYITCKLSKGKAPEISVPAEIEYEIV